MVDLCSHLLEDLTKTPSDIVESLKYLKKLGYKKVNFKQRITKIELDSLEYNEMLERFKEVEQLSKEEDIEIEASFCFEIVAYKGIVDDFKYDLKRYSISNHVFLDVSNYHGSINELAYSVYIEGFTPVFSGVEKVGVKHLSVHIKNWRDSGAKILVETKDMFGVRVEARRVKRMILRKQVDFICSNGNRLLKRMITVRLTMILIALFRGPFYAKRIFSSNAKELCSVKK